MAPVPPRSSPGLHAFHASAPHVFWAVFGVFAVAFLLLLGYVANKLVVNSRKKAAERASWPSYIEQSTLRALFVPRFLRDRGERKWCYNDWKTRENPLYNDKAYIDTHSAAEPSETRRFWIFNTTFWRSLFAKSNSTSSSYTDFPGSRSMSPTSKAWVAEHDHYWELQRELLRAGGPLCTGELIPWVPYIPKKSSAAPVLDVVHLPAPAPCVVKSKLNTRVVKPNGSTKTTRNVSRAPVLSIIAENDGEAAPAIVIDACTDASPPVDMHGDIKLALFEVAEYAVDYLRVPVDGEEPAAAKPILGSVNRSNYGGRFKLAAVPERKRASRFVGTIPARHKENLPPPGWF